jgi:hypothetical protein
MRRLRRQATAALAAAVAATASSRTQVGGDASTGDVAASRGHWLQRVQGGGAEGTEQQHVGIVPGGGLLHSSTDLHAWHAVYPVAFVSVCDLMLVACQLYTPIPDIHPHPHPPHLTHSHNHTHTHPTTPTPTPPHPHPPPPPPPGLCADTELMCRAWASRGECQANPIYMVGSAAKPGHCRASCKACIPGGRGRREDGAQAPKGYMGHGS